MTECSNYRNSNIVTLSYGWTRKLAFEAENSVTADHDDQAYLFDYYHYLICGKKTKGTPLVVATTNLASGEARKGYSTQQQYKPQRTDYRVY